MAMVCRRRSTLLKKYFSKVSWLIVILIKFHGKHHQVGIKDVLGFGTDLIGTLVVMATYSSHRLIMEET